MNTLRLRKPRNEREKKPTMDIPKFLVLYFEPDI